jgi:hypothetical protein
VQCTKVLHDFWCLQLPRLWIYVVFILCLPTPLFINSGHIGRRDRHSPNGGQSAADSFRWRDGNIQVVIEILSKGVVEARVEPVGKTIRMSPATYHRTLLQEKFARVEKKFPLRFRGCRSFNALCYRYIGKG